MTSRKRVVITGMGCVTPIGNDVDTFWSNLVAGKSGIATNTKFDITDYNCKVTAEIKDLDYLEYFERKEDRKLEAFTKLAIISSRQAAKDSGLLETDVDLNEVGCIMGVGIGGIGFIEDQVRIAESKGPKRVSPQLIPKIIANIAPGNISIDLV